MMTLVAHDKLHRLSEGKYARSFSVIPDFVIRAAILGAENLLPHVHRPGRWPRPRPRGRS